MMIIRNAFLMVLFLSVVACSKGGKDSEDDGVKVKTPIEDLDPNNIPEDRLVEWNNYVKDTEFGMAQKLIGVFDASVIVEGKTDKSYFIVEAGDSSNTLKVAAYNFMQDDVDHEGSCYRLATGEMINARLNDGVNLGGQGSIISYALPYESPTKLGYYEVEVNGTKLKWNLDRNQNVETVNYGPLSSKEILSVKNENLHLVVPILPSGNSLVTAEAIRANICSGEVIDKDVIGSNNYAGLYDVTLVDSNKTYETYLSIDDKGAVLSYKYMADQFAVDPKNCYAPSYMYNKTLHNRTLQYDRTNNRLYALIGQNTYYWNLDDNGNIVSVARNSEAASDSVVSFDDEISIGITKETSFTLSDIQNNICQ